MDNNSTNFKPNPGSPNSSIPPTRPQPTPAGIPVNPLARPLPPRPPQIPGRPPMTPPSPMSTPTPTPSPVNDPLLMSPNLNPTPQKSGPNKGIIIILCVVGAIVLLGIGFAVGFMIGKNIGKEEGIKQAQAACESQQDNCPQTSNTQTSNTQVTKTLNGTWKMTEASRAQAQSIANQANPEGKFYSIIVITDDQMQQCTDETMSECSTSPLSITRGQAALSGTTIEEVKQKASQALNKTIDITEDDVYSLRTVQNSSSEGVNANIDISTNWIVYDNDTGGVSAATFSLWTSEYDKISD